MANAKGITYVDCLTNEHHFVRNGKWALLRPGGQSWLTTREDMEYVHYTDKNGYTRLIYVSDQPFGCILASSSKRVERDGEALWVPTGPQALLPARQVHSGEYGPSVQTPQLQAANGPRLRLSLASNLPDDEYAKQCNKHDWVHLKDLAMAAGTLGKRETIELVLGYSDFSNFSVLEKEGLCSPRIQVVASSILEADGNESGVRQLTAQHFSDLAQSGMDNLWIPLTFAITILRLRALGYQPNRQPSTT